MRHQDQQPIHYLNLDMNFLDMKRKLIRDESQKNRSTPDELHWTEWTPMDSRVRVISERASVIQKRMKMNYGLVHFAITNQ